jgi:hypothetical protein
MHHRRTSTLRSTMQTWLRTSANGGDVSNGNDIYFSSDQAGVTRLAHEVESYSASAGSIIAWIKVPSLTTTTTLYVHYGDTAVTTSQENRAAVWTGYAFVAHSSNGALSDATSNNATVNATGLANNATGQIGSAVLFNGTDSTANAGSPSQLDNVFSGGGMAQAWIRPTSFGENDRGRILEKISSGGWVWYVDNVNAPNALSFQFQASGTDGGWVTQNNSVSLDTWQHVVVAFDTGSTANDPAFFINGAVIPEVQLTAISGTFDSDDASTFFIGNSQASDRTFAGSLDELRVSTTMRNAGWISTEYQNQSAPSAFYTIGSPL